MVRHGYGWWRRSVGLALALLLGNIGGVQPVHAQNWWPSRSIVDTPTAGLVPTGTFETRARIFPGGGVEVKLDVGIADWLSVGGSFGGLQIIGDGEVDWYPRPGFALKTRLIEETFTMPAVAFGVDTQGAGFYDEGRSRFQYKSRGVYGVLSKNYDLWGDFSVHGGINRSLEEKDDKDPNVFVGAEKSLGPVLALSMEYDLASNDNRDDGAYGKGRGYLNAMLGWSVAPQMEIRLVVRDMLDNSEAVDPSLSDVVVDEGWGREFTFSYTESF
ncbi:MAG: hypothetical protein DHS20C21_23970 [Gemmatimonadota bacterium]|nr:MAG: hypothetical protein DHS20C21_23970 [Gemmatimonadota bacterium]